MNRRKFIQMLGAGLLTASLGLGQARWEFRKPLMEADITDIVAQCLRDRTNQMAANIVMNQRLLERLQERV